MAIWSMTSRCLIPQTNNSCLVFSTHFTTSGSSAQAEALGRCHKERGLLQKAASERTNKDAVQQGPRRSDPVLAQHRHVVRQRNDPALISEEWHALFCVGELQLAAFSQGRAFIPSAESPLQRPVAS